MKPEADSASELRARALRLLARREHSRLELARKLSPHAESGDAVAALLDALEEKKQLSDARYAEERIRVLSRKYGAARIRQDLKAKGIADPAPGFSPADELERARAILERKYRTPVDSREDRARRMRFLQSRGFSTEIIVALLSARGDG